MASLQGLKNTQNIMKEEATKEYERDLTRKTIDMQIDTLVDIIKKCFTTDCLTTIKSVFEQKIELLKTQLEILKLDKFRYPLNYELRQLEVLVSHIIPNRLEEVGHLEQLDLMKRFAKVKYGMKGRSRKTKKSVKKSVRKPKKSVKI